MNRLDRLYALVEEFRAAGAPGCSARRLAEHFEVSVRTVERDILALQEAGVPISAQLGRRGGYVLDRSMTLPPLNFTPAEAVAMAVGLRRLDDTPWARDARTALLKIVAAMPRRRRPCPHARRRRASARAAARPAGPAIADAVVHAVEEATPTASTTSTSAAAQRPGGRAAPRRAGPNGSYVTGWCRLREDERVFRLDGTARGGSAARRIRAAGQDFGVEGCGRLAAVGVIEVVEKHRLGLSPALETRGHDQYVHPQHTRLVRVATDDPDNATSFYTDLFGWTFSPFAEPEEAGVNYRVPRCQAATTVRWRRGHRRGDALPRRLLHRRRRRRRHVRGG